MDHRRRRTDQLPLASQLPTAPVERGRAACAQVTKAGFDAALAMHVPDGVGHVSLCGASGRVEPLIDVAQGVARRVLKAGLAYATTEGVDRVALQTRRHVAVPVGRCDDGNVVLVVSDPRMSRRDMQALSAWASPAPAPGTYVDGGPCASLASELATELSADIVALAMFARSGMLLNLHTRSGSLLHACRIPADTVWGEVARHGAAFTLGDLPLHPGAQVLASIGMRSAALVGLENGRGIAVGALGVASFHDLDVDIAHQLLARAPRLGPELMTRLSSTSVPVPDEDGSVDLGVLAARVGCRRFAMYERHGAELRLVAAHGGDGSRISSPPDELEEQLVCWAAERGVGVTSDDAAAVRIGDHAVLYAQDPDKRALECLRLALQDIRRNPFGAQERDADAA